tara:strand:+ start:12363 stop:12572 length:210 start_codon:yes stop_codon:yes gene_type:complete
MIKIEITNGKERVEVKGSAADLMLELNMVTEHILRVIAEATEMDLHTLRKKLNSVVKQGLNNSTEKEEA